MKKIFIAILAVIALSTNFASPMLRGTKFIESELTETSFDGINLTKTIFDKCTFMQCTFNQCDLRGVNFTTNTFHKTLFLKCIIDVDGVKKLRELATDPEHVEIVQIGVDKKTEQPILMISMKTK